MKDFSIRAYSIILKSRGVRIFCVSQQGRATVYFECPQEASRYLQTIKGQGLQANDGR